MIPGLLRGRRGQRSRPWCVCRKLMTMAFKINGRAGSCIQEMSFAFYRLCIKGYVSPIDTFAPPISASAHKNTSHQRSSSPLAYKCCDEALFCNPRASKSAFQSPPRYERTKTMVQMSDNERMKGVGLRVIWYGKEIETRRRQCWRGRGFFAVMR